MLKSSLLLAALLMPVCAANAHEYNSGEIRIAHPWSQELPPNAPTVAAYFVIHNTGKSADRLLGVSVDPTLAGKAELHEHVMQGDLMKMQQVFSVDVPAGQDLTFAPMAYHVMLLEIQDRSLLTNGKKFPLTLRFEKAGDVQVEVEVQKQPPQDTQAPMHAH